MNLTDKKMDGFERREEAERVFALKNANNNNSDCVGSRFNELYSRDGIVVPIRQDAGIDGPLFSISQKRVRSRRDGKGIVAVLRDENGQEGEYLVEIDGWYGVEVTEKL